MYEYITRQSTENHIKNTKEILLGGQNVFNPNTTAKPNITNTRLNFYLAVNHHIFSIFF